MLEKGITRQVTLSILTVLALVRAQVGSGTDVGRKNQHEPDPTGLRPTQHEVKNVPPPSTSNQSANNVTAKLDKTMSPTSVLRADIFRK
jgi:hypothetical protein